MGLFFPNFVNLGTETAILFPEFVVFGALRVSLSTLPSSLLRGGPPILGARKRPEQRGNGVVLGFDGLRRARGRGRDGDRIVCGQGSDGLLLERRGVLVRISPLITSRYACMIPRIRRLLITRFPKFIRQKAKQLPLLIRLLRSFALPRDSCRTQLYSTLLAQLSLLTAVVWSISLSNCVGGHDLQKSKI